MVPKEAATAVIAPRPTSTIAASDIPAKPLEMPEVAPVKPPDVDEPAKQCSAFDMKSTKLAGYLQGTILPFALGDGSVS